MNKYIIGDCIVVIEKKIWPEYFKELKKGKKFREVRLADFKLNKGDKIIFKEWDPKRKEYTGKEIKFKVKDIVKIPDDLLKFYSVRDIKKHGVYIIELRR
jgi:ribosomal protein S17